MIKILAGLLLGLLTGSTCRWFDIPLPGPPKLVGALLPSLSATWQLTRS